MQSHPILVELSGGWLNCAKSDCRNGIGLSKVRVELSLISPRPNHLLQDLGELGVIDSTGFAPVACGSGVLRGRRKNGPQVTTHAILASHKPEKKLGEFFPAMPWERRRRFRYSRNTGTFLGPFVASYPGGSDSAGCPDFPSLQSVHSARRVLGTKG